MASEGEILQTLCRIYHRRAMPVLDAQLRAGRRSLLTMLDLLHTKAVTISPAFPWYSADLFHNLHSPGDLVLPSPLSAVGKAHDDDLRYTET